MKGRLIYIITTFSIFLSIFGCTTKFLKDYEPKSLDEKAIVSMLIKYEKARSSGDVEGCPASWHDEAKIMYGTGRFTTKAQYKSILKAQMDDWQKVAFGNLKFINISENEAKVDTLLMANSRAYGSWVGRATINLVKENNQWLLMSWKW